MFRELVEKAVDGGNVKWQRHALERMMERGISRNDVKKVLSEGELIEEYEDDHPLPSGLFLGLVNETALHVIAAIDRSQFVLYYYSIQSEFGTF